jgi:hypothetical protein
MKPNSLQKTPIQIVGNIASIWKKENLVFVVALFIATFGFLANFLIVAPVVFADETSYLANAAVLAGFTNDMANGYHAGYSILITPAFVFASDPAEAWIIVKIINAIMLGITFLALNFITIVLSPKVQLHQRIVFCFLVAIYPMWFTSSGYAMSENAYVPIFLLTTLTLLYALNNGG